VKDVNISLSASRRFVVKAPPWHVNACRSIPSRRFLSIRKEWVAPVTRLNSQHLLNVFGGADWSRDALLAAEESANPPKRESTPFPDWYSFKTPPFDHQRAALDKAWAAQSFGFFMEMGTGKTKTTIDLICAKAMDGQINAALVVSPLSMVLGWRDEIIKHSTIGGTIERLHARKKPDAWPCANGVELADGFTWYLANIEGLSAGQLKNAIPSAIAGKTLVMVVDESARIKNHEAERTKACIKIGAQAKGRYILSGLPVLKGALDLYSQLEFLDPDISGVGDFYCFRNRYAVMGGWEGREILGYQNLEELASLIAPHVYQITKKEALDLPDKIYRTVRVELTLDQLKQIRMVRAGLIGNKDRSRSLKNVLEKVLRIQQISSGLVLRLDDEDNVKAVPAADNPKMQALRDLLTDYDGQAVIWCSFLPEVEAAKSVLDALKITCVVHTGDTKPEERRTMIASFQAGEARVFLSTVQSGGIGITLTAASLAVYVSNSWSLEARAQSEDRLHRIGQVNKVEYVDIMAEGSVDELVRQALSMKRSLADHIRTLINNGELIDGVE